MSGRNVRSCDAIPSRSCAPMRSGVKTFSSLVSEVRACTVCEAHLPLGPRPVFQLHPSAKILIVGQAPGRKVHESGLPFNDPSGTRLREWLGVTRDVFYDAERIALVPMGFCFPGSGKSGDLPPRPECAHTWRKQLLDHLGSLQVTLALGQYAQAYHFGRPKNTLTELVKSWRTYWPDMIPMPHPSPRNNRWLRRNPWFESELVPCLQKRVAEILAD